MPNKRVSLKGKGADLFFGDYAPAGAAVEAEPADSESVLEFVTDEREPVLSTPERLLAATTNERTNGGTDVATSDRSDDDSSERSEQRTNDRPDVPTNERTEERPTDRSRGRRESVAAAELAEERRRVRHSFDIFEDQLWALSEIQAARFNASRRKPKLGELVQEALDLYVRTNERTDDRPRPRGARN